MENIELTYAIAQFGAMGGCFIIRVNACTLIYILCGIEQLITILSVRMCSFLSARSPAHFGDHVLTGTKTNHQDSLR